MSPIWVNFLGNWGEITLKIDRFHEAFTQHHKRVCQTAKNLPLVSKKFTRIYPPYPRHFPTLGGGKPLPYRKKTVFFYDRPKVIHAKVL